MDQAQGPGHESSDHGQVTRRKVITTGVGVAGGFVLAATGSASPAMATEGSPATAARAAASRRRPRIVLNAFEVRADTTPEVGLRVSRPGYPANVEGVGITEPDADPRVPALEEDPELRWEAYDEYWRKVHGPKHLHRDGPEDNTTHLLLRYEQQHRIPAGPTSLTPPPYRPQVDASGRLLEDPYAHVAGYRRPTFDGLAQLAFRTREEFDAYFGLNPGDKFVDKIVPDEKVFLKGFAFNISKEIVRIPYHNYRPPVLIVKSHRRHAHLTREQFQRLWLQHHAPIVERQRATRRLVRRYVQLHTVSVPADGPFYDPAGDEFDGITLLSFATMGAAEEYLVSEDYADIARDEETFSAESEYFTAINFVIVDQEDRDAVTLT